MNFLRKLLPRRFKLYIFEHQYMFWTLKTNNKKKLKKLISENKEKSLMIDDENKWIKKLNKVTYSNKSFIEIGYAFATSEISIMKDVEIKNDDIIAICVEKNDLTRLKKFIEHHRKIGIDKFIILDNNSNDGSIEWLLKQNDVATLKTQEKYSSMNRDAWINRIIAHYGDERWYLIADSDELLVYNDCENKKIQDVIAYCKKNNIVRLRAIMLDMYGNVEYYKNGNAEKFYENLKYFDTDSYYLCYTANFINLLGGPRERVFNTSPILTKYPLVFLKKKDVYCKSHYLYPYKDNLKSDCFLVLKHYKFLPGEFEKYKKIAKDGNYSNGSFEYKKYIEVMKKENGLDFFYKGTEEYINSNSLNKINVYKSINWEILK